MKIFPKLLVLIFVACYNFVVHANGAVSVIPSKVVIADFYEKYVAIAQFKNIESKDYFAKTDGKVDFVLDEQGAKIPRGTILLSIDGDIADQMKNDAKANLYLAESTYNRDLSLLKKKVTSQEVLNASKAALEKAKTSYVKTLHSYDNMVIQAPYDSYVGVIKTKIGDEVKVGDYLFSLTTKSDFYAFAELPEIMRGKILVTDDVNIALQNGDVIDGKILSISDYVSNNGTITAKLWFPYNEHLTHGAFIETNIIFNKHSALGLPEKSVLKNNEGDFVYKITPEKKVERVFLKLGVRTNNMIELLSGNLQKNDLIVLDGLTKIYEGSEVILDQK